MPFTFPKTDQVMYLRLPRSLYAKVVRIAEEASVTRCAVVRQAVEELIARHPEFADPAQTRLEAAGCVEEGADGR